MPLSNSPRKNSSSAAGAKSTVAMAMTTNPAPWEAPVSFWEGALKLWMSCWKGAYRMATSNWPPSPIAMPTRSISLKRRPRSRTKLRVPWVRLASQGAPTNPIHRPNSVTTTYHSGGTEALAIACISADVLPGDGAGDQRQDDRAELPDDEADDGVEQPHRALALGLRGDPRRIEEGAIGAWGRR